MIVAGFGCRTSADSASLEQALAATGIAGVDMLAICTDRMSVLHPLGERLGLPMISISPERLVDVDTSTQSVKSIDARGVGSVAEAVALLAAGPDARLLHIRHIGADRRATCALAVTAHHESRA